MKHILAILIAAFTFLSFGSATAATPSFSEDSVESLSSPLVCDEDKKKKKKDGEEEPECD
ncbi:MAG: hypothetical protein KAU21_04595 [Gammaproteobacteria bacterium]|nr:hypothetical protein [Gammaproteobacteria bacterium]